MDTPLLPHFKSMLLQCCRGTVPLENSVALAAVIKEMPEGGLRQTLFRKLQAQVFRDVTESSELHMPELTQDEQVMGEALAELCANHADVAWPVLNQLLGRDVMCTFIPELQATCEI
jgi:hypothetical protein